MSGSICNRSYFGGIFDSSGNICFRIKESQSSIGYKIHPTIIIYTQNEITHACIDRFLIENHIKYKFNEKKDRVEIVNPNSIRTFMNIIKDFTVQHKNTIRFISDVLYPMYNRENINRVKFARLVKTIEKIQPRRKFCNNIKYSSQYFINKYWDGEKRIKTYDIDNNQTNDLDNIQYLSGFFDGSGRIRPIIVKDDSIDIGYKLFIRATISQSWIQDRTLQKIKVTLNENNIEYNVNKKESKIAFHISDINELSKFIELTERWLVSNYEISQLTIEKIIPAIEDDYHKSKQGVYDIIRLYESVIDSSSENRKYTSDFFVQEWNNIERF